MELEAKLKSEAITLANNLSSMTDKRSEAYAITMQRYQDVMRLLSEETKRLNSTQELELQAKKLEVEKDKVELESMQKRLEADLKEEELRQHRKSNWWAAGLKVLGGIVAVGANLASVYCMIRFNNSGETLTSFENKFVFPEKFK